MSESKTGERTAQPAPQPDIDPALVERVTKKVGTDNLTMYRLAGVWSDLAGRRVREQQCYNYRAKGVIKETDLVDGKITPAAAVQFLVKRLSA
jgi:hypothetical protein